MRKTYFPRLAIKLVQAVEKVRDREYEMEFALPPFICVFIGGILAIVVFCVSVQIANEIAK